MNDRKFDVFFSYNSKDREAVTPVFKALRRKKRQLKIFMDQEGLAQGGEWLKELGQILESSRACLVFLGPNGIGPVQDFEIQLALIRRTHDKRFLLIPVLLPGSGEIPKLLEPFTARSLREGITNSKALRGLALQLVLPDPEAAERERRLALAEPYRGLTVFREEDAPFFCGREDVLDLLEEAIDSHDMVALVGASGSGKSSIVQAGLIPSLRHDSERDWQVIILRPSDRPLRALASAFIARPDPNRSHLDTLNEIDQLTDRLARNLPLRDLVEQTLGEQDRPTRMLLVIDQWEELYTECKDDGERRRFIDQVLEAVRKSRLTVVTTLRVDFLGKALEDKDLSDQLRGAVVTVGAMSAESLRDVILEPGKKIGLEPSELLVDRMLAEVEGEASPLPLLEFALRELWLRWRDGETLEDAYIEMKGVRGAIAARADGALKKSKVDERLARGLFLSLVHVWQGAEDVRRRATLQEIGSEAQALIDPLVAARILVTGRDQRTGYTTLELAHEALVRHWPKLREWTQQSRDYLLWRARAQSALEQWQRNAREPEYLLVSAPLAEAEGWLEQRGSELGEDLREFIRIGVARRNSHRAALAAAVLVAIGLLILLAGNYYGRWLRSLSRALAAESVEQQSRPADLRLLLSLQAFRMAPTVEARGSLIALLEQHSNLRSFLPGKGGTIYRVAVNRMNRTIATAGLGPILLWNAETGERLGMLAGHDGQVLSLAFSPDGETLVSSGSDKTLRFWNVRTRREERLVGLLRPARALVFNADGSRLALSRVENGKGVVVLWDVERKTFHGAPLKGGHTAWITSLDFSPRGDTLASGSADGNVVLWNTDTGQMVRRLTGPAGVQVMAVAFRPDGRFLASGGSDGKVRLWDVARGEETSEPCKVHESQVFGLAFSPNGQVLASTGRDRRILLWNLEDRVDPAESLRWTASNCLPFATLTGHGQAVWSVAFTRSGRLVSAGDDGNAILWDLRTVSRFGTVLPEQQVPVMAVARDARGEWLASGGTDGSIFLRNLPHRGTRAAPSYWLREAPSDEIRSLAFSPERGRRLLASGDKAGKVLLWDLDGSGTPAELTAGEETRPEIWAVAFSPDGNLLAAGDQDGGFRVWDVRTRRLVHREAKAHKLAVLAVTFSPRGRILATASSDRKILLWNVVRYDKPAELTGHSEGINSIAFSPNGELLASGSADLTVRLWDVKTAAQRGSYLTGPDNSVTGVTFGQDGRILAASSEDGRVFLWDVAKQLPIGAGLHGYTPLSGLAFAPDGSSLVAGGKSGVLSWDLRYETWRRAACRVVQRNLTRAEWHRYLAPLPYEPTCPELPIMED
jgi:WD40 repeat protein/energy-coupling factor transporter ATP-binding protein EcfA2